MRTIEHRLSGLLADRRANAMLREFMPYFAISVAALGVDFTVLLSLATGGLRPGAAAAVAWTLGLVAHYLLARRFLYTGIASGGPITARLNRFLVYALPSLAGLPITVVVVEVGVWAGLALATAKAGAAVLSFVVAFLARSLMFGKAGAR